jgi:hypothetical protein
MTELFDIPESLSPKLKWLKQHGLVTKYDAELECCPESPETGETCYPWLCGFLDGRSEPYGVGKTEEDAIGDFCHKTDTPHYSL